MRFGLAGKCWLAIGLYMLYIEKDIAQVHASYTLSQSSTKSPTVHGSYLLTHFLLLISTMSCTGFDLVSAYKHKCITFRDE